MRQWTLALALVLSACSGPVATEASYDLFEFGITGPVRVSANSPLSEVTNSGQFSHTLVVTDTTGQVLGATDIVAPGEAVNLDLDLDEGTYRFTCRIVAQKDDGSIVDHFEAGMDLTVTVEG